MPQLPEGAHTSCDYLRNNCSSRQRQRRTLSSLSRPNKSGTPSKRFTTLSILRHPFVIAPWNACPILQLPIPSTNTYPQKNFWTNLFRDFPNTRHLGPVMSRILELIHGWKDGTCMESWWKEDLGNIRDMHMLFKACRFRELPRQASSLISFGSSYSTLPFSPCSFFISVIIHRTWNWPRN